MKRRMLMLLMAAFLFALPTKAVLKEDSLIKTLSILRVELTNYYKELNQQSGFMKDQQNRVQNELIGIMNKSDQNALMLYSQRPDNIFDQAYACHEATEQFAEFQRNVLPFAEYVRKNKYEISRYDSLITNLSNMYTGSLTTRERIDRNVCLTLAVNIRHTLKENNEQSGEYLRIYESVASQLRNLNAYANKRYASIQQSIFYNGGDNYFNVLLNLGQELRSTTNSVVEKYRPLKKVNSQWDVRVILSLFLILIAYGFLAFGLSFMVIKHLIPKRFRTKDFMEKRTCIILSSTVLTFAFLLIILRFTYQSQNFLLMASNLLISYAWLLSVILISSLLRLNGQQIKSAFHIYVPLIVMSFIVISFRIILIPNDLVNLVFPPMLLLCAYWQWSVIQRHKTNVPRSDVFYSYTTLLVFVCSVIMSWSGYTLMSVQLLIWWVMQLSCILTITCVSGWLKNYAKKRNYDKQSILKTWPFNLVYKVIVPMLSVYSFILSIYWAADVFNLSDTTWLIFTKHYIDTKNFSMSIFSLCQVITLYFIFAYLNDTGKQLLKLHFKRSDRGTASSRNMMAKNVLQILVWGIWLLVVLNIFHVSNTWLVVVSGGLSTGIGFAMKDILENIYYGISLMAGRVKIGDYIVCDGIRGKVSSISYTSTMIEAIDGSVIAFQNSQLFTKNYKNMTKNHGYELDVLEVGVAYGVDIAKVKTLLRDALMGLDCVNKDKGVNIVLYGFGDSSITLKILVWVNVFTQYTDDGKILECVYNTLNENHIEIPFPQRDIHIIHQSQEA